MNRSDWPRLCVSDKIVAFGSDSVLGLEYIHMLYLKWLEFAQVVHVSVEIIVEGFEYLQNTGSQLILFKK